MKNCILLILFTLALPQSSIAKMWHKVWSDEFNYSGLPDTNKWGYDTGTGQNGWGNNELEYYTFKKTENARVENGLLLITAKKEKIGQKNYSSARLITKNKGDWLYGRFEISAKIPKGKGIWPALWMLPTDWKYGNWPASGEIDIMENVGFEPNTIHFTIHAEGSDKGATIKLPDPYSKFVVYALEWNKNQMDFYADTQKVFTYKNDGTGYKMWPFDKRFHILLNIAVGGNWGGQQGVDSSIYPQQMIIDYVRVFELDTTQSVIDRQRINNAGTNQDLKLFVRQGHLIIPPIKTNASGLKIYSLSGKIVADLTHSITTYPGTIQMDLTPGPYVIRYTYGEASISRRIMICH
jgi:beta-glucanase (GH16 family)